MSPTLPAPARYETSTIDKYTPADSLEPFWKTGKWDPAPTNVQQYFRNYQFQGPSILNGLQAMSIIPASEHFLAGGDKVFPHDGPKRLIDMCSANAFTASYVWELAEPRGSVKVVSLDKDEVAIADADRKSQLAGWEGFENRVGDALGSGYPDGSFTHLTISYGIFFFPDTVAALKGTSPGEFHRLLAPNGMIWLNSPAFSAAWPLINRVLADLGVEERCPEKIPDWESTRVDGMRNLLQQAGFEVLRVRKESYTYRGTAQGVAEVCVPGIIAWSRSWSDGVRDKCINALRAHCEKEGVDTLEQQCVVAIGRKK